MSRDVTEQVAGFVQVLDREHPPITIGELVELSTSDLVPGPRRRPSGGLVAVAAAAVVILVVGGLAFLLNTPNETAPAAATSPPTTVAEATPSTAGQESPADRLPKAEGTVAEYSGNPSIWSGASGVLGPVSVQQATTETTFIPYGRVYAYSRRGGGWTRAYGGIVETRRGYTALGVTTGNPWPALATSSDGISWEIIDFQPNIPDFQFGTPARLFEAGGWYWIGLNEPYIYRSFDSIAWERIDLNGSDPRPMGVPVADQRWHEFGDRLVAPTSEGLVAVDVNSGAVETFERPWSLPPDGGWWWMTVIDDKLTAFVSTIPDTPLNAENPIVEQYETTDLLTWEGPLRPVFSTDQTTGVLIHGDVDTGLVALDTQARRYFSSDGTNWQGFVTLSNEPPNGDPWHLIDQSLAPIRVNGRQGIALLLPREINLSVDGIFWQPIYLDGDDERAWDDGSSRAVLGNRIFYYEYEEIDGSWLLNSWIISIGE